jgi:formamidopyrimidine-DNA glycosylase
MIHAWEGSDWQQHPYLSKLGPEPLVGNTLGAHLLHSSRRRSLSIKTFLMDAKIIVGVGNIYACEALFRAGVHPERPCASLSAEEYQRLARCIRAILRKAIKVGGTTFRDFKNSEGEAGYFAQALAVYGREDEACLQCATTIKRIVQGGRSSWYCSNCQI